MLSIEEIKNVSFRKASIGGYKPEDVDVFIDQVLITIEQLKKEKSDLVKKMDILATRVEEYRADEDAVRNALLSAQRVADTTIKEARAKSAYIIEEAENMAKAKLYDLNVQIKMQKKQYSLLLAECNRVRDEIINNCNKHIMIAKDLPSAEKTKAMEAAVEEKYPTNNTADYERAGEVVSAEKVYVECHAAKPEVSEEAPIENDVIKPNEIVIEEKKPAVTTLADDIFEEINIITDIDDKDVIIVDPAKKEKKRNKAAFAALKFGDDYDFNNDNDDFGFPGSDNK